MPLKKISVIGSSSCDKSEHDAAFLIGKEIASRGAILICGGLGGVMEAAAKGAKEAAGITIGVLPGDDPKDANPFIDIPIATGLGESRNVIIAQTSDAVIAVGGALGTLSEIAFALKKNIPVIGINTWDLDPGRYSGAGIFAASSPSKAVDKAFAQTS